MRTLSTNWLSDYYDRWPKTYNIYSIALIATIGGLMFGFDISSVSSFVSQKHYVEYFNHPSSIGQGGITASMAGGSFLASLVNPFLADPLGRRVCMQIASLFWMIGALIQSSAQNQLQLICGRLIAGLGIGVLTSTAPSYCSEISPKRVRGLIGCLFQWAVTIGIMVMFFMSYGCSQIDGVASFRIAWGLQIIPGLLLFVGVPFLPESPRWLANHGRWDEAEEVVANVNAKGNREDRDVIIELEEIKEQVIIDEQSKSVTYFELFNKRNLRRTVVGISAQVWQQMCGMNVMMYYIVYIFEMAGFTGNTNLIASSIQYVLNVVMTIPALIFIDKVGRRPLLLVGGVFMMIWLFAVAGLLATYSYPVDAVDGNKNVTIKIPKSDTKASHAVIACSYLFVCSFLPTWGPLIWLYCSEIFPNVQRAKANGLTTATNWIFNFALAMFVPSAFKNISWKTYIIFGVFCFVMTIQVFFMFPETRGKTLEEISQIWIDNVPPWRSASYVPEMPISNLEKEDVQHSEDVGSSANSSHDEAAPLAEAAEAEKQTAQV